MRGARLGRVWTAEAVEEGVVDGRWKGGRVGGVVRAGLVGVPIWSGPLELVGGGWVWKILEGVVRGGALGVGEFVEGVGKLVFGPVGGGAESAAALA